MINTFPPTAEYLRIKHLCRRRSIISNSSLFFLGLAINNLNAKKISLGDLRVGVPSATSYTYPDATIICGKAELEDDQFDTAYSFPEIIYFDDDDSLEIWFFLINLFWFNTFMHITKTLGLT